MQENLKNFSDVRRSVNSDMESADSSLRNNTSSIVEQSNSIKKLRRQQSNIVEKEREKADKAFNQELLNIPEIGITFENLYGFLDARFPKNDKAKELAEKYIQEYQDMGKLLSKKSLNDYLVKKLSNETDISSEERAVVLKEKLLTEGKSDIDILKTLLTNYRDEPEMKTFVENWENLLKLHKYAQTKPPQEQKAIQKIISQSDFTSEESFSAALFAIQNHSKISSETKLDIQRSFKTTGINTIRAFDYALKQEKRYKENLEKRIDTRNNDIQNLNDKVKKLKSDLKNLLPDDTKRAEIEAKIKEKGALLSLLEHELAELNKAKPENVQFLLREDLKGILNVDGTRSVKINSENFSIQLPSNKLPFSGIRNLRSINTAFPYLVLQSLNISDEVLHPDLINNSIPSKSQRDISHLILSSLGIDDSQIIFESDIKQLKDDLSHLVNSEAGLSGRESLIGLGVYNLTFQSVNKTQLKRALRIIRMNRGKKLEFEDIRLKLTKSENK
jgi:hypothetical protein